MSNKCIRLYWASTLVVIILALSGLAQNPAPGETSGQHIPAARDGQHDFDFEIGSWKIHLKRLDQRLVGCTTWTEFDGTSVTRKVWDGRANLEEFEVDSPTGHIEGLTLRLYDPQTHQWNIYWATSKSGSIGVPTIGEFKNGRGEFYDTEPSGPNGRAVLVRFIWSNITPNSAHFEQSFSDDGGKTWEVNWITDQTRVKDDSAKAQQIGRLPTGDREENVVRWGNGAPALVGRNYCCSSLTGVHVLSGLKRSVFSNISRVAGPRSFW